MLKPPHPLIPGREALFARGRADFRCGLPVVVGGHLAAPVETAAGMPPGAVLALTRRRAEVLRLRVYHGDLALVGPPAGLSDAEALRWARDMADPARDLGSPLKAALAPLRAAEDGLLDAARTGIALAKAAELLPAVLVAPAGDQPHLTHLPPAPAPLHAALVPVVHARVPLARAPVSAVHVLRAADGRAEHYAIRIGRPDPETPVLARLHSACFTGDVLGSLKCDCGPQLDAALGAMAAEGSGVLLYLNQEGRGIGLANKMRAYQLQDQGFDTVEANHRLGFEDDERDLALGADLLRAVGIGRVRLLTNNPRKIDALRAHGIEVTERVPLLVGETPQNRAYLETKRRKSGHLG